MTHLSEDTYVAASGRNAGYRDYRDGQEKFFQGGELLDIGRLKPNEAIHASLPLAELFAIQAPGEYTVLASLPVIGDVDAVLTARAVKIRVPTTEKKLTFDLGKGIKLEIVLIPAGEFLMGSPDSEKEKFDCEKPQHRVRITKRFYLGKYLVTQEQWEAVMGSNSSYFKGPKIPVEAVSWDDCQQFLGKLNAKSAAGAGKFVLPSEAQWEYACRAGSETRYCFGDDEKQLGEFAWYDENSGKKPHPVGEKKPNAWALFDMHGNA